jgi:hypothetical protein
MIFEDEYFTSCFLLPLDTLICTCKATYNLIHPDWEVIVARANSLHSDYGNAHALHEQVLNDLTKWWAPGVPQ